MIRRRYKRELRAIKTFFSKLNLWYYKIPDATPAQKPFDCIFYNKTPLHLNITIPPGLHSAEFKQHGKHLLPHQVFHLTKTNGYIIWWKIINNRFHFEAQHISQYKKKEVKPCQDPRENQEKHSTNTEVD